jgi:olfactory receptor
LFSLGIHSSEGKRKALSTCRSHIAVVVFCHVIFIYAQPSSAFSFDKIVSILYTIVTALLNPMIYTFWNKKIKIARSKLWKRLVMVST